MTNLFHVPGTSEASDLPFETGHFGKPVRVQTIAGEEEVVVAVVGCFSPVQCVPACFNTEISF